MLDTIVKARAARAAALRLQASSDQARRGFLEAFASNLEDCAGVIAEANEGDVKEASARGDLDEAAGALLQHLRFDGAQVSRAAEGVRAVAALPDPLGRTLRATLLDEGLTLSQVTVPVGVVAGCLEARPETTVRLAALCLRSGNALLLHGGTAASRTHASLAVLIQDALESARLPPGAFDLLETRAQLAGALSLEDLVDLVVARGRRDFVRWVQEETRIPLLGHAEGVCHTYVDAQADAERALAVCLDAKLDDPAACNATECFLVHERIAAAFAPRLVRALEERGVVVVGDEATCKLCPSVQPAQDEHWGHEFGGLGCAIRVVQDLEEAIAYINAHGSRHTDAILTADPQSARAFVEGVDSASVFVNASTRFADGHRYGLGAEVGISTGKLHARGPVGLEALVTTKWVLRGQGHVASAYQGPAAKRFLHESVPR